MPDKNELARIFGDIAVLLEVKGDNPFKVRAYQTAARIIEQLTVDLAAFAAGGGLEETRGIGKAIGDKIREYLATGRIAYYEELKAAVPAILFELIKIPGLGPKKALALHEKLAINSIGELEYACRENRLAGLPGFGRKTQEKVLAGIRFIKLFQGRFLLSDVQPLAENVAAYLAAGAGIVQARVAGSIRRRQETVKDIDIVVAAAEGVAVSDLITGLPGVDRVTGQGPAKVSVALVAGISIDVRIARPAEFAAALHHFTGSREHHVKLRGLAREKGIRINEYGLEKADGERVVPGSEEALYQALGLHYIEPELREGDDEIELAAVGGLPRLVEESELKGVFHVHTTYSDGSATLAELAAAVRARGWQYVGISDHSRSAVYARGLKLESIVEQRREIERLNGTLTGVRILAGIESDILPDGSLDYPDDVLAGFDFVIASVHSAFRQSEAEMTKRIIRAMENRYVSMLGHPTGRILLARDGYALDLPAVIAAAAGTGTVIEINASPYRLDLDWRWCRRAKEAGVLFAVNPDAHAVDELGYAVYGTGVARKGRLTAGDIVNTRPAEEALALLRRKRGPAAH